MEEILNQLGINGTIFYQFAIILLVFLVSKYLFLDVLRDVIELREKNTVGLESNAKKNFAKADELLQQYQGIIDKAHHDSYELLGKEKNKIIENQNKTIKKSESEIEEYVEGAKKEFEADLLEKKKIMFDQKESLADQLVTKMTR